VTASPYPAWQRSSAGFQNKDCLLAAEDRLPKLSQAAGN
jgi:hypothetical protein